MCHIYISDIVRNVESKSLQLYAPISGERCGKCVRLFAQIVIVF